MSEPVSDRSRNEATEKAGMLYGPILRGYPRETAGYYCVIG